MKQCAMGMSVVTESESLTIFNVDRDEEPVERQDRRFKILNRYHVSLKSVPQSSHGILRSV